MAQSRIRFCCCILTSCKFPQLRHRLFVGDGHCLLHHLRHLCIDNDAELLLYQIQLGTGHFQGVSRYIIWFRLQFVELLKLADKLSPYFRFEFTFTEHASPYNDVSSSCFCKILVEKPRALGLVEIPDPSLHRSAFLLICKMSTSSTGSVASPGRCCYCC